MNTIKGFSTKKDVLKQFAENKVGVKLNFSAKPEMKVKKNPFSMLDVKESDGKEAKIVVDKVLLEANN